MISHIQTACRALICISVKISKSICVGNHTLDCVLLYTVTYLALILRGPEEIKRKTATATSKIQKTNKLISDFII